MHHLLAAAEHPLIDIDGTVFLQLGLFLIAFVLLSKFLFKPYLAVRAAREDGIEGAREEAKRIDEEVRAQVAEYEAAITRAKVKAGEERASVRTAVAKQEKDITEGARQKTTTAIAEARARLQKESEEAAATLKPKAVEIARSIAKKILGREVA